MTRAANHPLKQTVRNGLSMKRISASEAAWPTRQALAMNYVGSYNSFSAARFALLLTHLSNPALALGDAIRECERALAKIRDFNKMGDAEASRHLRRLSRLVDSYNASLSAGGPLGDLPPNEQHQLAESASFLADWFLQRLGHEPE